MKKKDLLAISAFAVAVAALSITATLFLRKKTKHKRRLTVISDAGYETAYDIHYPLKYGRG